MYIFHARRCVSVLYGKCLLALAAPRVKWLSISGAEGGGDLWGGGGGRREGGATAVGAGDGQAASHGLRSGWLPVGCHGGRPAEPADRRDYS